MEEGEKKPQFSWREKRAALTRQLRPYKSIILTLSVLEVVNAAANGVVPYISGKFFDTLITPYALSGYPAWVVLLSAWALIQLIANALSYLIDRRQRRMTTEIEAGVQAKAFAHLLTLPVSFHKTHRTGEINDNVSRAGWMLGSALNTALSLGPQFLTILIGVAICFYIYAALAWILLAGVAAYLLFLARVLPSTAKYQEEGFKVWNRAMGDAQDAYTNVSTVKQAGAEEYESKKIFATFYDRAVPLWYRMERTRSNLNASQRVIVTLTQGAILLYSVFLVAGHAITIGDLIAFNAYAGMIIGPFVALGGSWQTIQNALTAVARVEIVFGTASEAYEPAGGVRLPSVAGEVAFKDVHFAYEAGQAEILKGVSFEAKPGEVVAFVGETGVGKSTTADLISAYYFATSGVVEIDGHDIRSVNLRDLRAHIAIVPQEVVLFNASIKENIRYGRPEATDAEVESAAKRAYADAFIAKFPEGYAQEVGERGIKLSVGQKQRIAIARAMLRDPAILILDEPTSALDAETERHITESLEALMQGRTTFIIAHRLSTVREADRIIVLEEGRIAEQGTHEELLALKDHYARLYHYHIGLHE